MKKNRQLVFDKILDGIARGIFRPNEKIHSENQMAQSLGVKRTDVREALMALELMGVVKSYQGQGCYLSQFGLSEQANPFSLMVVLQRGNPDEIMAVRIMIEL